jgi:predicted acetyltransferase
MSLHLDTLDTFDDPDVALATYFGADAAAFGGPPDPAQLAVKAQIVDPARYMLARWDGEAVGGTGSYDLELTLPGGAQVAAAGVSDVGVVPTHRRRGILTALMQQQLRSLAGTGTSVAVLHASEGGIYRRFGFGPATRWRHLRADTRRVRFIEEAPDPGGSMQVIQRGEAVGLCAAVHDRVRRTVPGGLSRPEQWWPVVLGDTPVWLGGTAGHLVLAHCDAGGEPDGYAIYAMDHDWSSGQAHHELKVWELVGESPAVELALWRTLLEHDLVATVSGPIPVDHPLFDVVADGRQVGIDWEQDLLWARPLDIATLLSARTYRCAGRLVLAVHDPFLPEVGGTFELSVDGDGVGECRRTDAPAELHLDAAELGGLLLGGSSCRRLARAGRVHGEPFALSRADELFAVDPLPWCWVRF